MLRNSVAASQSHHSSATMTNNNNVVGVANRAKSSTIYRALSISSGILIMTSCFISGYCFHTYLDTNYQHWMRSVAVINTMSDTHALRARSSSRQLQQRRNNNLPEEWETYSFSDIYQHFHCSAHAYDETKPIPSLEQWLYLRMQYNELVDGSVSFNDAIPPTQGYTLAKNEPPPFYAKLSPGKGRGLFASRDIQKGEVVHDGSNSDVVFPDAMSFRRFLFASPRTMACDVMEWAWTQQFEDDGPYHICLAINISSLMNTKGDDEEGEDANALPVSGFTSKFYALKDIKKDEEILTDYTIYDTDWVGVGMDEPKKRRRR